MREALNRKYGEGNWCLFYHSLHRHINGYPLEKVLEIAVKGLKPQVSKFKLGRFDVCAYRWDNDIVAPNTPFRMCGVLPNSGYYIPSEYTKALETLYGPSYERPYSKYTPDPKLGEDEVVVEPTKREGIITDMGIMGSGDDLSSEVTVCFLDGKYDINREDALAALQVQDVKFRVLGVVGFSPLADALNAMRSAVQTKYFIQCDNDMVLYPDAIKKLHGFADVAQDQPLQVCYLKDVLSGRDVQGIKIYNNDVLGPEKWEDVPMPTPALLKRIGKTYGVHTLVVGEHSPKWTDKAKFDRGADLAGITKTIGIDWVKKDMDNNKDTALQAGYDYGMKAERTGSKSLSSAWPKFAKSCGRLNVVNIIDQWGWAFDIISKEIARYSQHNIMIRKGTEFALNPDESVDVVHVHGLGCGLDIFQDKKDYTAIGQYSGCCSYRYTKADYELSISPHINAALPMTDMLNVREGIDTYYWLPGVKADEQFVVGWSGRQHAKIKRTYLLDKLDYPVKIKADWGKDFFVKGRTQDDQLEFYRGISCLILTSESECQPRVILEAMSCGIPVIAPAVGRIPDMIDPEWVVPVEAEDCVKGINDRLKRLQNDPGLAKAVGQRNRRMVMERWSWAKLAPVWDSLYEACHNHKQSGIVDCECRFKEILECPVD